VDGLRDLLGELPGGHQHQRRGSGTGRAAVQPLQHRQGEGGRLSGAGRRLAQQVMTFQQRRDGLTLDRSRLFVPQAGQRLQQLRPQRQAGETRGVLGRMVAHDRLWPFRLSFAGGAARQGYVGQSALEAALGYSRVKAGA
jgi:hypothetical protein